MTSTNLDAALPDLRTCTGGREVREVDRLVSGTSSGLWYGGPKRPSEATKMLYLRRKPDHRAYGKRLFSECIQTSKDLFRMLIVRAESRSAKCNGDGNFDVGGPTRTPQNQP